MMQPEAHGWVTNGGPWVEQGPREKETPASNSYPSGSKADKTNLGST